MQKNIAMNLDFPLRLAIFDKDGQTVLLHQSSGDYCRDYEVENHSILEKVEALFATLASEFRKQEPNQ